MIFALQRLDTMGFYVVYVLSSGSKTNTVYRICYKHVALHNTHLTFYFYQNTEKYLFDYLDCFILTMYFDVYKMLFK